MKKTTIAAAAALVCFGFAAEAQTYGPSAGSQPTPTASKSNPRSGGFTLVPIGNGKSLKVWGWPAGERVSHNGLFAGVERRCPSLEAYREPKGTYPDGSPKYHIVCIRG